MRVLVDTHTLMGTHHNPVLSKRAKRILTSDTEAFVFSLASLWKAAIKIRLGKLTTIGSSISYLRDVRNTYGMDLLPIRYERREIE